ncbi:hypothetical protein Tco_0398845, partial [Tanacetum coccineum]
MRCEDVLATQVICNLAGEIQVVNFDDDIEEMDFADIIEHGYIMIVILKKLQIDTDNEGTEVLGVSD